MNAISTLKAREVMQEVHFHPAISIVMPFEPKMQSKKKLTHLLKLATDKIEHVLFDDYSDEIGMLMIEKLEAIVSSLDYSTLKRSIAIYLNPVFQKVLYLDIPVKQKITVDDTFKIGDLLYSKILVRKYLVLLLDCKESGMYVGGPDAFVKIITASADAEYTYLNDLPEPWTYFYDIAERKRIIGDKYLYHIDNTLGLVLNAYQLPLFILGDEKTVNRFKNITKHTGAVIDYVYGNYEGATTKQVKQTLEPYVADWKKVFQKDLSNRMAEAAVQKKLAVGIRNVWREAMRGNGRLLIVEKNFMYNEDEEYIDDMIYKAVKPYNKYSYIKDVVDDIIEKVLERGGDVEFVDKDVVKNYRHIATVQYY